MNLTDVDDTICKCAQEAIDLEPPWYDRQTAVFQVELGFEAPLWICLHCLIGLEEW